MRIFVPLLIALGCTACGGEDGPEPPKDGWQLVFEDLPGALISVSGTSSTDIWAVGGNPGDGSGAFVLHFDGTSWKRVSPGVDVDLWWVHAFAGGPAFFGGANGTILKYEDGSFQPMTTPSQATVFGIWGTAPDKLWAVGGTPTGSGNQFIWRYDGTQWTDAPGQPSVAISSYFKVWGKSDSDVRVVGMDGVILHWDGAVFTQASSPVTQRLLTLHVDGDGPWTAVGGNARPVILEDDGSGWKDVTPSELDRAMIGVRMQGSEGWAVGNVGTVLHRGEGGWSEEQHGIDVFGDFHSVFVDDAGGVWAAGGDIAALPLVNGILLHKGKHVPSGKYQ
ncbi:MAG: hypothetical protein R3B13_36715 [Polyangiaceae bacterium]